MYKVPDQYYFRIHHCRSRFKNDVESVLLFMAEAIAGLPAEEKQNFDSKLDCQIRTFPGNDSVAEKTIKNWRTEISTFFSFIEIHGDQRGPGLRAKELAKSGDLMEFFKTFLFLFQYPGAHIKARDCLEQIENGVHFKPAQYILKIYKIAQQNGIEHFGLTKAEACHCIFNDLRATTREEGPLATFKRIQNNKTDGAIYDQTGDVVRYAGDILDYMANANLLREFGGTFYLNKAEGLATTKFIDSKEWFGGYDSMIANRAGTIEKVRALDEAWNSYANKGLDQTDFATNIIGLLEGEQEKLPGEELDQEAGTKLALEAFLAQLQNNAQFMSSKAIGDVGEGVVISHEKKKLMTAGFAKLIHLVLKIPTPAAVGYDIQSIEDDGSELRKYIEVKTTISRKPVTVNSAHLTSNEWRTAETVRDRYYLYRLQITSKELVLFVMQNPVELYSSHKIFMSPQEGAYLRFSTQVGKFEPIKI